MIAVALAGAIDRWTLFAAVLVSTGAAAFRFLVLARLPADLAADVRTGLLHRTARLGVVASIALCAAALGRLPIQARELADPAEALGPQVHALVFGTTWGTVWMMQVAGAVLLGVAFVMASQPRARVWAWLMALLVSLALCCAPAMSGHAIGSERLPDLAVVVDVLHVIGAALWLGAMVSLFAGSSLAGAEPSPLGWVLVGAFSPLAIAAATTVGVTGLVSSWLHLGAFGLLWRSRYGRVLLLKLASVGIMAGLGAHNWRRAGPALRDSGQTGPMRRSIRAELIAGGLVLLATAMLVVTPGPGEE